jgi:hypothetical protein
MFDHGVWVELIFRSASFQGKFSVSEAFFLKLAKNQGFIGLGKSSGLEIVKAFIFGLAGVTKTFRGRKDNGFQLFITTNF